jgi:hypothetical protein
MRTKGVEVSEDQYLSSIRDCCRGPYRIIGDRSPEDLCGTIPEGARLIYIHRDPRDILVSNAYHHLNHPNLLTHARWVATVDQMAAQLRADPNHFEKHPEALFEFRPFFEKLLELYVSGMRSDMKVLESLRNENPEQVLVVRYETLHGSFDREVARIHHFLGLDPSRNGVFDDLVLPGFGKRSVQNRNFFRKGKAGDWMRYFYREDAEVLWGKASDCLIWGGYARDAQWMRPIPSRKGSTG